MSDEKKILRALGDINKTLKGGGSGNSNPFFGGVDDTTAEDRAPDKVTDRKERKSEIKSMKAFNKTVKATGSLLEKSIVKQRNFNKLQETLHLDNQKKAWALIDQYENGTMALSAATEELNKLGYSAELLHTPIEKLPRAFYDLEQSLIGAQLQLQKRQTLDARDRRSQSKLNVNMRRGAKATGKVMYGMASGAGSFLQMIAKVNPALYSLTTALSVASQHIKTVYTKAYKATMTTSVSYTHLTLPTILLV